MSGFIQRSLYHFEAYKYTYRDAKKKKAIYFEIIHSCILLVFLNKSRYFY